jgi:branched-chain amino acid aminotransferase
LKKKALDWGNLSFSYIETDYRFSAIWEDGEWSEGELITSSEMSVHEGSPVLHYAQTCFEGLKAQTAPNGDILLFRPDLNCERMASTTARLMMPGVPGALFMRGVEEAVRANASWVPPHGSGASLYIRPFLVGVGENLGLRPAPRYEFRVFVSPVGPYYKGGGLSLIDLAVIDLDRAAPKGTGAYKAGANYAGGLMATQMAKDLGASEALYLDPAEHRYLEEAGSANIVVLLKDGTLVTPKSPSILPSVTRRSVMTLAADALGHKTEERAIDFLAEVDQIDEFAACGTAAVISPVGKIRMNDKWYTFFGGGEAIGPVTQALYDRLTAIQKGETDDPYGWTRVVAL